MNGAEPFAFYTERRLVLLTGRSAKNLEELVRHLREVSGACIFYHTHHQFLSHHFEKPVVHNEFASWAGNALQEEALAEQLTAIDLLAFSSVRQIREEIVAKIETHLQKKDAPLRDSPPGEQFHFCESQSFVMPTGAVAQDVPDFFAKLGQVTTVSVFFHFFEARLRLGGPTNDFSKWLEYRGQAQLAADIDRLDPYIMTLEELREEMIRCGRQYGVA